MPKKRLDVLLVDKGLASNRSKAQAFIMAGNILIAGKICDKCGMLVAEDAEIEIKKVNPFVSRGGLKLESALNNLGIKVAGATCLDVGASTGGFTDCLLQRGALKVYAVDVGYGQLALKLRQDARVINIEQVNFRYFDFSLIKDEIDFSTIDVSFISLDKILPIVQKCIKKGGQILAMIKPQFELSPKEVKKGVVRDEALRQKAFCKIKDFARGLGMEILGEADSGLKGPKGNLEHFLWLENL
jgi:23S rRNA (cytidine1920-2'-O)/16S rRNA (cytidine1409-2'-O)-methyltransferase